MNLSKLTITLVLAANFAGAAFHPAHAADEDMNASVYLTFDPETGEFITQQATPSGGQPQAQHQQAQQAAPAAQQQAPATATAARPAGGTEASTGGNGAGVNTGLWLGGLLALVLLAGVGYRFRKGQNPST